MKRKNLLFVLVALFLLSCNTQEIKVNNGNLSLIYNKNLDSKIVGTKSFKSKIEPQFSASSYIVTKNTTIKDFKLENVQHKTISSKLGKGSETLIKGIYKEDPITIEKIISLRIYDSIPDFIILNTCFVNKGQHDIEITKWVLNKHKLAATDTATHFWSFQGSSTPERADWVLPVDRGFYQKNFMGMNASDYGGGIPVVDVWRKDIGIAIGHLAIVPKEVSLPVSFDKYDSGVEISIEKNFNYPEIHAVGDTLKTLETFITIHHGDYFTSLQKYSKVMQLSGIQFVESEPTAFEPIWCGWGYMRSFTKNEIIGTLPKVKELGIKWVVIDDGYQIAEGDWRINTKRFPKGDKDMKDMVSAIHNAGLKAKLWWAPLAADPGSDILKKDPNILLINKDGAPQYITWWDSYYLSPAYVGTQNYTIETVKMMMRDWEFDGLKLDGQHMNAVPADYNWNRPLDNPNESIEKLPQIFKIIYQTARDIKPHAVVENCPCGCCMSFYNMPYTNQFVSSDPTSSWQIRLKGKTYKAIKPQTAYYGDHVELSDYGNDFASSFGIGAVLGTKFTWPKNNPDVTEDYLLTPNKELIWKKWFTLYNEKMLSTGEYLGSLYDIGFDKPETHVIKKDNRLYYAFYSPNWKGTVSFKGLQKNTHYKVMDYVNNVDLGEIDTNNNSLYLAFDNYLLVELIPTTN